MTNQRVRELDFYFYEDRRARRKDSLWGMCCAAITIVFGSSQGWSQMTIILLMGLILILFFLLRLHTYHPLEAIGNIQQKSPGWLDRRTSIGFLLPFAVSAVVFLVVPSGETEAAIVNDKLRSLKASGDKGKAEEYAKKVVSAHIAIEADTLPLIGYLDPTEPGGELTLHLPTKIPRTTPPLLQLASGEILTLLEPVVYLPPGTYRVEGTIQNSFVTLTGESIQQTSVTTDRAGGTLFQFQGDMLFDAAILNVSFLGRRLDGPPTVELTSVDLPQKRIAMVRIEVRNMVQTLDKILWEEVRFEDCIIKCLGNSFELFRTRFVHCQFIFGPTVPSHVQMTLQAQGQPVTIKFRP